MLSKFFSLAILLLVTSYGYAASGAPVQVASSKEGVREVRTFPEMKLRGYGTVSGRLFETSSGSVLEVGCETPEKARLLQAKYLSDLQVLPGVSQESTPVSGGDLHSYAAAGQGGVAALQSDKSVFILAADSREKLAELYDHTLTGDKLNASSTPQVKVPMFLDRWDKFGFRFYYTYAWTGPEGRAKPDAKKKTSGPAYDFLQDFEFAKKNGHSGLVFWLSPLDIDTAEGLSNESNLDYAIKAATENDLPVGVNLTVYKPAAWLFNRYPDQMAAKMPQFLGTGMNAGQPFRQSTGKISAVSTSLFDTSLAINQEIVRKLAALPNVVSYLEPHGELRRPGMNIFMEYGPVADPSFREFLQKRYATIADLNKKWGSHFADWNQVRVPEMAEFAGWNDQAIDLTGTWRLSHEELQDGTKPIFNERKIAKETKGRPIASLGAPAEWFAPDFDDAGWPEIVIPGNDKGFLWPNIPAVVRRTFDVPADWLSKNKRAWIYVWDLNEASGDKVKVVLNGETVGEEVAGGKNEGHWGAFEVTSALKAGKNQLSIRLPRGVLRYRVYITGIEPAQYPDLGPALNAKWADFSDWTAWTIVDSTRRGIEMIRQVDADRPIDVMAPDAYADGVKTLAKMYGVNFKNTGYMAAFWADFLPAVMRGAGLPCSVEPGGPAQDLPTLKTMLGNWSTEGIQGVDYFQHIGTILWNPELKDFFERNLNLFKLIGKYHAPPAEVAALYSVRPHTLTVPWNIDPSRNLDSGYFTWNVRANLRGLYESDGITESSFEEGDASKYKVIFDTNTSFMDEKLRADIEKYVSDGGTFVSFVETGRHSSSHPDVWQLSQLTGYEVLPSAPSEGDRDTETVRRLKPAHGQSIVTDRLGKSMTYGASLKRIASDAQDILVWNDKTVAAGIRPIGKGYLVTIGCRFSDLRIPDRVADMERSASDPLTLLLKSILAWRGVTPVAADFGPNNRSVILRHFLSNNGLYDVWVLFNQDSQHPASGSLSFPEKTSPTWGYQVVSGDKMEIEKGKLPLSLAPLETAAFLTPRYEITGAPADWFALQRGWWQGTVAPPASKLPPVSPRLSLDLGQDWSFHPLADGDSAEAFVGADVNDSAWEKMPLGVWNLPKHRDVRRAILRRTFVVPEQWGPGEISLWIQGEKDPTFIDSARIWVDGKLLRDWTATGLAGETAGGIFKPGSSHALAMEITGSGTLNGTRGTAWLWYRPKPEDSLDLSGEWHAGNDLLHFDEAITLPGMYDAFALRKIVELPAQKEGLNVVLAVQAGEGLGGIIFNGKFLARVSGATGERFDFNVTPWVKLGQANEIELLHSRGPGKGEIKSVSLDFYKPATYP
jgi:hypothetical protein